MTITEFLLARIAEDVAVAKAATDGPWYSAEGARRGTFGVLVEDSLGDWLGNVARDTTEDDAEHIARWDPVRVLRRCESDRRIVDLAQRLGEPEGLLDRLTFPTARAGVTAALRVLAAVYADHPDYREEWRP